MPAQSPVMIVGGLATLVGMLLEPGGQVIAWIAWAFLQWTILVVEQMAALPFAAFDLPRWDILPVVLYYLLLFGIPLFFDWRAFSFSRTAGIPGSAPAVGVRQRGVSTMPTAFASTSPTISLPLIFAVGSAIVLLVWLWNLTLTLPDGKAHVVFLDAGGPATLVRTPNGSRILIDGGSSPSAVLGALGDQMPFWDRSLDLMVLTYPDDNHLSGLVGALERFEVRQIIQPLAPAKPNPTYVRWSSLTTTKRTAALAPGNNLQIAIDGVTLDLCPMAKETASPLVLTRLAIQDTTILFADALGLQDQTALLDSLPASTLLVAPDRLAPEFLDTVSPSLVVLFTGTSAREKPSPDLLATLSDSRAPVPAVWRTDDRGTMELIVDGQRLSTR